MANKRFNTVPTKSTIVTADKVILIDSEDSQKLKQVSATTFQGPAGPQGPAGTGDMSKATYDPTNINGDAFSRANHTGTQAISTITNLQTTLDGKANLSGATFTGAISASNLSNVNSGDETTTTIGTLINGATSKTTPVDADMVGLMDSAGSNILKKLSWANIKATLKTYFDTLYQATGSYLTSGGALGTPSSGTLTNCTFPTLNQDTTGKSAKTDALNSATTTINVSSATAPTAGQVLTATDSTHANWQTPSSGGGTKEFRITIPGELIANTSNYQGLYFRNTSGSSWTISNVAFVVGVAAAGTGAAAAFNLYKSSGTDSNGINTSATALFTTAVDLGTGYTSLTNTPNTTTVENGRWLSLRVTSSAGATNKSSDLQCIITYS